MREGRAKIAKKRRQSSVWVLTSTVPVLNTARDGAQEGAPSVTDVIGGGNQRERVLTPIPRDTIEERRKCCVSTVKGKVMSSLTLIHHGSRVVFCLILSRLHYPHPTYHSTHF